MSGKKKSVNQAPLVFGVIEELRRKGYNQTEIAEMHGVTRQAVSWHKVQYGGHLTPRQRAWAAWPWETTHEHGKAAPYQRLRDHGEFMASGGKGMSENKLRKLRSFYRKLREENVVVEFDPTIPPTPGVSLVGCFRYAPRRKSDGDLLIRVNKYTKLSPEGRMIWRWPQKEP